MLSKLIKIVVWQTIKFVYKVRQSVFKVNHSNYNADKQFKNDDKSCDNRDVLFLGIRFKSFKVIFLVNRFVECSMFTVL